MNDSQMSKDSDAKRDASTNGTAAKVNNDGATEATSPAHPGEPKRKKKGCGCLGMLAIAVLVGLIGLIAVLPLLSPFVLLAQYSAEAMPVIGNLRTKIELYRVEKDHLPGLRLNADGTFGGTSQLEDGQSRVQTFIGTNMAVFTADFGKVIVVTNGNHVFREVGLTAADATGQRLRPKHLQYRVDAHKTHEIYVRADGIFGDGDGLKVGTGYAVMEYQNVAAHSKGIATWERYKPECEEKQVVMVNAAEAKKYFKCETPEQAMKMNLCWVGDTDALMSGDKKRVDKALEELRRAGWDCQ